MNFYYEIGEKKKERKVVVSFSLSLHNIHTILNRIELIEVSSICLLKLVLL